MRVRELPAPGEVPLWQHPAWAERFPWLLQATTGAGDPERPFDLGLFGRQPVGEALDRWRRVRAATGMPVAAHSRQVHGAELARVPAGLPAGLVILEGLDGLVTDAPGVLLSVSIADCVPVFLVDPERRAVGVVHAGWRGVAAGILERAVSTLAPGRAAGLHLHLGPAICGACYEVGPEVHAAVHPDRPAPPGPTPIDLRAALAARAARLGVPRERVTTSEHCTRCGPGAFFSHRGGSAARQMALLGVRR